VTFTEKTRYIFEINKGIMREESLRQPYEVNRAIDRRDRRVPFKNMIYVGDGLTDIPCFSLMEAEDGLGFGVFNPTREIRQESAGRVPPPAARSGELLAEVPQGRRSRVSAQGVRGNPRHFHLLAQEWS
jgi:hypothetical protein